MYYGKPKAIISDIRGMVGFFLVVNVTWAKKGPRDSKPTIPEKACKISPATRDSRGFERAQRRCAVHMECVTALRFGNIENLGYC